MHPLEQQLLKEVLARPKDDTPRLIYADWLDENGQRERAELIRIQCELAKMPARLLVRGRVPQSARHPSSRPFMLDIPHGWDIVPGTLLDLEGDGIRVGPLEVLAISLPMDVGEAAARRIAKVRFASDPDWARREPLARQVTQLLTPLTLAQWFGELVGRYGDKLPQAWSFEHGRAYVTLDYNPGEGGSWTLAILRGFVGEVCCTGNQWARAGRNIIRLQPIERVYLTERDWPGIEPATRTLFERDWPGIEFAGPGKPAPARPLGERWADMQRWLNLELAEQPNEITLAVFERLRERFLAGRLSHTDVLNHFRPF